MLVQFCKYLNITELHTLDRWILWYVNCISINLSEISFFGWIICYFKLWFFLCFSRLLECNIFKGKDSFSFLNLFIFNIRIILHNTVLASSIDQHESAIGVHMSHTSWTSLLLNQTHEANVICQNCIGSWRYKKEQYTFYTKQI